jgi:lysophospholipase L1-like esterase
MTDYMTTARGRRTVSAPGAAAASRHPDAGAMPSISKSVLRRIFMSSIDGSKRLASGRSAGRLFVVFLAASTAVLPFVALDAGESRQHPQLARVWQALERGDPVTIAYFGGSITWGATATDPLTTSWRALVTRGLEERFPRTRIRGIDAAIGGQPSKLGVFRVDRDVILHRPDLCFVEFAVNDWGAPDSAETIEGIVRKLLRSRPDMAIVLVLIGSGKSYAASPSQPRQIELAGHYGLPLIDVATPVAERISAGLEVPAILTDGCHPNDAGYRLYADLMLEQLAALATAVGTPATAPAAPLTPNRYESAEMIELSKLPDLGGWKAAAPSLVGTWFDHQPSRWHSSSVVPAAAGATLAVDLDCSGLGLYYEATQGGGEIVLAADGKEIRRIETAQDLPYVRVMFRFDLLDGKACRHITLTGSQAERTKAAYLLLTR